VWKRSVELSRYAVGGAMEVEAPGTSTDAGRGLDAKGRHARRWRGDGRS
jgi:hypothetical protein